LLDLRIANCLANLIAHPLERLAVLIAPGEIETLELGVGRLRDSWRRLRA
jgi:hypothetical protein